MGETVLRMLPDTGERYQNAAVRGYPGRWRWRQHRDTYQPNCTSTRDPSPELGLILWLRARAIVRAPGGHYFVVDGPHANTPPPDVLVRCTATVVRGQRMCIGVFFREIVKLHLRPRRHPSVTPLEKLVLTLTPNRVNFSERPLIYRVARGIRIGLAVSLFLSVWATIAYALKDARQTEAMGITLREVVAAYLLGGLFGGAFAGAMIRLMRWAAGAFVLGFVTNLPTTLMIANVVASDASLPAKISLAVICACIGGIVALYIPSDPWPGLL